MMKEYEMRKTIFTITALFLGLGAGSSAFARVPLKEVQVSPGSVTKLFCDEIDYAVSCDISRAKKRILVSYSCALTKGMVSRHDLTQIVVNLDGQSVTTNLGVLTDESACLRQAKELQEAADRQLGLR
ncbi:MAG: hypothetical protein EA369_01665 [Bradymonadales bacterium]|nr:MAG: hypothetical protein EA369_01665 [Bradymonadales bacterium]